MHPNITNVSLSLGGVHCGGEDYGLIVLGRDDPAWPGMERGFHNRPYLPGGVGEGGYLQPAEWEVPCRILASSEAQARTRLENLLYLLHTEEAQQLIFDSRPDVYFNVAAVAAAPAQWDRGGGGMEITLGFRLDDPTGYAVAESEKVWTVDSDPDSLTLAAADLGAGGLRPRVSWILNPVSEVTATITLFNAATGESFSCTTNVGAGAFIKFDADRQEVFTSADGETWARNNSGASGTVPGILPRVENALTLGGVADGTLTALWRERYAGLVR